MAIYLDKRCDHEHGPLTDIATGKVYRTTRDALMAFPKNDEIWVTCEFCLERRLLRRPKWLVM